MATRSAKASAPTWGWRPGLLQTEDYARAVIGAALSPETDDDIERNVALRMSRQPKLADLESTELWTVINEGVIRRLVGGPTVMRAQLDKLLKASCLPNVTVQVMPFSAGAHAGMGGAFTIIRLPEPGDPDVAYVNYNSGSLFLEKPEELRRCALIFDHLCAVALSISQSQDIISCIAGELA